MKHSIDDHVIFDVIYRWSNRFLMWQE